MAAAPDASGPGPRFVLDGSVALSWCFPDERGAAGGELLSALAGGGAAVPALWFLEVSNALLTGERRKRLTADEADQALSLLGKLPLDVDVRAGFTLAADLMVLARRHGLSAYDAAYLELAQRRSLPLATLDRDLMEAATALGVAAA